MLCLMSVPAGHASSTKAQAQTRSYMLIMATPPVAAPAAAVSPITPITPSPALAAAAPRPVLQLYDLGAYKTVASYAGFLPPAAAFTRASISRDGR